MAITAHRKYFSSCRTTWGCGAWAGTDWLRPRPAPHWGPPCPPPSCSSLGWRWSPWAPSLSCPSSRWRTAGTGSHWGRGPSPPPAATELKSLPPSASAPGNSSSLLETRPETGGLASVSSLFPEMKGEYRRLPGVAGLDAGAHRH